MFGLADRLFAIALSSYIDLGTDILVTVAFFQRKEYDWGRASLTCVSLGPSFQVLFAWLQYHRQRFRKSKLKMICALCGFLPIIEVRCGEE